MFPGDFKLELFRLYRLTTLQGPLSSPFALIFVGKIETRTEIHYLHVRKTGGLKFQRGDESTFVG